MQLLERTSQLQNLKSALELSKAGQGCVALVYGESGIGKTALVEHFIGQNKKSWRILQGACDSLFTPRPLGPLHDIALQISSPKGTQGNLLQLLESESNRTAIFSAGLNELKTQATILVIEDVHWADEATLDLLKFLGRRIRQTASLMILTYRDDELGVDHPLRLLLGDLASSRALQHIPVSALSKDAVRELAKDNNVDSVILHRRTNGNPFFVTEVLAGESDIPETIREAVLARSARLSAAARSVLEAAAVIGSRMEPWLLSKISGAENSNIEECISRGMLHAQADTYAFRHELARQTILESISSQRRLALHHKTLNALKESPETSSDFARLTNHAEATSDMAAILEYAPAAARQASVASSHREAATLYELALQFAQALSPTEHAQMLEAYAVELDFKNRMTEVMTVLRQAIELWHSIGNRLREGANLEYLAETFYLLGRNTESEETSQAAITMLEALPPSAELAQAYKGQSYIRMAQRDCSAAIVWGEKAIPLARQFEDAETLSRVYSYLGSATMVTDYERGRALMEQSLAIAREANLPFALAGTLDNLGAMSGEVFQFAHAERYLTEGITFAREHDDDYHLLDMLVWKALTNLYQGRWAEANEGALMVLRSPNADIFDRAGALLALGRLRVRQGSADAQPALDEALKLSLQADSIPRMGIVQAARAESAWLSGDYGRIFDETNLIYEIALNKQHPWITGELAFWRWRAGDEFTPPVWTAEPFALQIAGDWRGAAKEWKLRDCFYEAGMALMDGDETAQLAALEIFGQLGASPIIEKLKQKMRAEGIRIPRGPRPATRENPFNLTAREMEVLGSLARGLSNNAIAKQLSLSARTVEHHISSILQKMEVQSRAEAVALALKENLLASE